MSSRVQLRRSIRGLLLVSAVALSAPAAEALESSNLDLVTQVTRLALHGALEDLRLPEEDVTIGIGSASTHAANWLVEHLLAENLLARGLTVALDGESPTQLTYRVVDIGINGRSGLLGGSVERRCRVVLRLELRANDELIWSGDGHAERQDRVPEGQIDALQHARFGFARTDLDQRTWGKYVEPAIVTSVLGSLVYLFFSNR